MVGLAVGVGLGVGIGLGVGVAVGLTGTVPALWHVMPVVDTTVQSPSLKKEVSGNFSTAFCSRESSGGPCIVSSFSVAVMLMPSRPSTNRARVPS